MYDELFIKYDKARTNKDLDAMEKLYFDNPRNLRIKFTFAKMLIDYCNGERLRRVRGKNILLELLDTRSKNFALSELGKLEFQEGNYNLARKYYLELLNNQNTNKDISYALLGLGKISILEDDYDLARIYLIKLLNSNLSAKDKKYASLELGRLERRCRNYDLAYEYFGSMDSNICDDYSKLEIAKMRIEQGKAEEARKILYDLCNAEEDNTYSKLELGKTEIILGNDDIGKEYINTVYKTADYNDKRHALYEIIRGEYFLGNKAACFDKIDELYNVNTGKYGALYFECLIYLKNGNYEGIVDLINKAIDNCIDIDYKMLIEVLKNLNVIILTNYSQYPSSYITNQIIDYDEYVACEYVIEKNGDLFNNIDIYSLFNSINLSENYKINKLQYCDEYIIPYDNIGLNGENILKVLTIPNTKKILTMYPAFYEKAREDDEIVLNKRIKMSDYFK